MKNMIRLYLALSLLLSFSSTSLAIDLSQYGSEGFRETTSYGLSYPQKVDIARSSKGSNNIHFADPEFVNSINQQVATYGGGEKLPLAATTNYNANFARAAARTEARTGNFLSNGATPLIDQFSGEGSDDAFTALAGAQEGDPELRYIEAGLIKPEPGVFQSADNQEAFRSAQDNALLGLAEQKLFKGDQNSAINFFNQKAAEFKKDGAKQTSAIGFQREGILRQKQTADTFSDFFRFKESVSQRNSSRVPTRDSLLANCQAQSSSNDDQLGTFYATIPAEDLRFYQFDPPTYDFDFCETYVDTQESYLLRNTHVPGQLQAIAEDSGRLSQGLTEVSQFLSQDGKSLIDINNFLSTNKAWQALAYRAKAHEKCAKTDCLKDLLDNFDKANTYKGSDRDLGTLGREIRALTGQIIETGQLPEELRSVSSVVSSSNTEKSNGTNTSRGALALNSSANKKSFYNKLNTIQSNKGAKGKDAKLAKELGLSDSAQIASRGAKLSIQTNVRRSGKRFRDEEGILRGQSGKPILGFEAPPHLDLFKIISNRYRKKYFKSESPIIR